MSDETQSSAGPGTIEERLAYLEEQNEGLKRVGKMLLGLCLLTAGLLVWTQMGQRSSLYSEAVIFGSSQNPRGTITTTPTGHLAYLFYDHLGILPPNPKFGAIPYLDGFVIYDRQGNPRIVIGVDDKDQAIFDVINASGQLQFSTRQAGDQAPVAGATPAPGGSSAKTPATPSAGTTPAAPSTP